MKGKFGCDRFYYFYPRLQLTIPAPRNDDSGFSASLRGICLVMLCFNNFAMIRICTCLHFSNKSLEVCRSRIKLQSNLPGNRFHVVCAFSVLQTASKSLRVNDEKNTGKFSESRRSVVFKHAITIMLHQDLVVS